MRHSLLPLALSLTMTLLLAGLFGCGSDDPVGPGPDPGPDWPEDMALPAEDEAAFEAATDLLRELRAGEGFHAARDSLLQRVADGWPGIASAHLGSDGLTVTLVFPDGVDAQIFTDEWAFGDWEPPEGAPRGPDLRVYSGGELKSVLECGDVIAPPNRKVHIVNLAGASNPESRQYTTDLEAHLQALGWDEDEVDISQRESYDDFSITPDTVFQQEGYGIVLFIAHGGFRWDEQGTEHFVMQTFRGGSWSEQFHPYVTEERWQQYKQWFEDGRLCKGSAWCEPDSVYMPHINVRDDLLAEQMVLEEGAMVSFICCNSIQLDDELTSLGAGSVLAWDGSTNGENGMNAWWQLFARLSQHDMSDAEALAWMQDHGYGYSPGHGVQAEMELGGGERAWQLPASLDFVAPDDCRPVGTQYYEVAVRFPDCPEFDATFDFFPGGAHSLPPLPPTGAEIELRAKDASGNTLAAGLYDVDLHAGANPFDLCPCEGSLLLDLTDYPVDGDHAAAAVHIDLSYDDPTVGAESFDLGLPVSSLDDLIPGGATLDVAVLTAAGDVLGTATVDEDAACDNPRTASFCVGWLSISAANYPTETAELVVTAPGEPDALPASLTIAPGGEGEMYGFAPGSTVSLAVEAYNGLGVSLGTTTAEAAVSCGETSVEADFALFGIVVEAAPYEVAPNGEDTATVTATLRYWRPEDQDEPTGDPLPGVTVVFDTNRGFFVGPVEGVTDAGGQVSVELASTDTGVARVMAYAPDHLVQTGRPAPVNFGASLYFWIDQSPESLPYESIGEEWQRALEAACVRITYYANGEFSHEIEYGASATHTDYRMLAEVGTARFVIDPLFDCSYDSPLFGERFVNPLWLHYFWVNPGAPPESFWEFGDQNTVLITNGADPLTDTIDVELTIVDPILYPQ